MPRTINLLMIGALAALAVRQHKLACETDRLSKNTGAAFAAVTRHFERAVH